MTPKQAWEFARAELLKRIAEELAAKPEGQQSIWDLDASEGDMWEFPTMLEVIDRALGAESLDYRHLYRHLK